MGFVHMCLRPKKKDLLSLVYFQLLSLDHMMIPVDDNNPVDIRLCFLYLHRLHVLLLRFLGDLGIYCQHGQQENDNRYHSNLYHFDESPGSSKPDFYPPQYHQRCSMQRGVMLVYQNTGDSCKILLDLQLLSLIHI